MCAAVRVCPVEWMYASSATDISSAVWKRSAGSRAMAFITTFSSTGGTCGL